MSFEGNRELCEQLARLQAGSAVERREAVRALGQHGSPYAVESLLIALHDADACVREAAADALGRIGDFRAAGFLVTALGDTEPEVRVAAADALGRFKYPETTAVAALEGSEPGAWPTGPHARRTTATSQVVASLITALQDEVCDVRLIAALSLAEIKDLCAVESLSRLLAGDVPEVCLAAAYALGEIGSARAVSPLIGALDHPDEYVRTAAGEALLKIHHATGIGSAGP